MVSVADALRMVFGSPASAGARAAIRGYATDHAWRLRAEERDAAILTDHLPLSEGEHVPSHRTEISFYLRGR